MRDITLALKDEKGKVREFADFKREVETISSKYNENWLRTEYNFAIASAQNAARWVDFENDARDIPFLMYQTVGDNAVRQSHAELDGIVRKINDVFWNTHYPPNGYGCRCEAVQAPGVESDQKEIPSNSSVPQIFRTNLAKTGLIYPKGHPYFKDIPAVELRKALEYLPAKNSYLETYIGNHEINIHPWHGDKELDQNLDAVNILLKHDEKAKIQLLPVINDKDKEIKHKFYSKKYLEKYPTKNADISYNGKIAEIEHASGTKSSIQNRIKDGKKQSDFVMLQVPDDVDMNEVIKVANGQMKWYENKEDLTVWVFNSNEKIELKTKQKRQ